MKTIIILFIIAFNNLYPDLFSGELKIDNIPANITVTINADVVWGADWENYPPLDEEIWSELFNLQYTTTGASIYIEFHGDSSDEEYGDGDPNNEIIDYGLYSISIDGSPEILLDYRDCDYYGDNHLNYYSTGDVVLEYHSSNNYFISGNNNIIDVNNPLEIWTELKNPPTQNTSLFLPTNPTNLSYTVIDNKPNFSWTASEPEEIVTYTLLRDGSNVASNITGTTYTDLSVHIPGFNTYNYKVQANLSSPYNTDSEGYSNTVSVRRAQILVKQIANVGPDHYSISNYPNPFNPNTRISFDLPERSNVDIIVYDILGKEIKSYKNSVYEAGSFFIVWEGTDHTGLPVPSGVYIYTMKAVSLENNKTFVKSSKMIFAK